MGNTNKKQQQQQQFAYDNFDSECALDNDYLENVKVPKKKNSTYSASTSNFSVTRLGPKDYVKDEYKTKEICALIITINDHNSYDALYQSIEQTPPDPNQFVSVYQVSYGALAALHERMNSDTSGALETNEEDQLKEILEDMKNLDGENIVINFECCGTCSDSGFGQSMDKVLNMTKTFIERKFIVMFSDFSVKALIKEWRKNDPILGSNPFYKVGEFQSSQELKFNVKELINCDFAQLQNVGELCEKGTAEVHAPGGTILYSIKKDSLPKKLSTSSPFDLNILTIVSQAERVQYQDSKDAISILDENGSELKGLAGHVVLSYKNGGKILTSCGHWVELVKLDVTKESLLIHAERNYGKEYAMNLDREISSYACDEDRMEKIRVTANCEVQKKAPCRYKTSELFK